MFRTCSKNDTYDTETSGLLILQANLWSKILGPGRRKERESITTSDVFFDKRLSG